jgi:ubiquinone/menaquinone biosynthesis C-methylase UbiE
MPPRPDYRLRRLVQMASDIMNKPLDQIRVLDLACLEGQYGIEFALQGAEVIAIEIREANIEKAKFVKQKLNLGNIEFYQDDVRNLSPEKYGYFDIVICSGILYHLQSPDVFEFIKNIYNVCQCLTIFDTFIGLSQQKSVEFEGKTYWGLEYIEHDQKAEQQEKYQDFWASIDNVTSFWLTEASFCNFITNVGFTSFCECHAPTMQSQFADRKTYIAIKGKPVNLISSPITNNCPNVELFPGASKKINQGNIQRSIIFKFFKKNIPQSFKDIIKPTLRAIGYLPEDKTPKFIKASKK